jgi:hypothetical protein
MQLSPNSALANWSTFFRISALPVIGRWKSGERRKDLSRALYDALIYLLVALVLFFSEFRKKPADLSSLDYSEVASALMPATHEPYRAPLRRVVFRKPKAHQHPRRAQLISISVRETLECGHKLDVFPSEAEPLIAKYRRCPECMEVLKALASLPPKKPAQSVRAIAKDDAA